MPIIVKYLITFFVGILPIIELRGAIPIGVGLGLSYFESFIFSFLGNILPIYFIVKYIRPLFDFFGRWKPFKKIIDFATNKATKKIEKIMKLIEMRMEKLWKQKKWHKNLRKNIRVIRVIRGFFNQPQISTNFHELFLG